MRVVEVDGVNQGAPIEALLPALQDALELGEDVTSGERALSVLQAGAAERTDVISPRWAGDPGEELELLVSFSFSARAATYFSALCSGGLVWWDSSSESGIHVFFESVEEDPRFL